MTTAADALADPRRHSFRGGNSGPRSRTTTMWLCGGSDHDDVSLSWFAAALAAGSVMPVRGCGHSVKDRAIPAGSGGRVAWRAMSLRFAMVSDTHVGMTAASVERLRPVYAAIARRAPDFVLHCGDITDTGLPGEYERYWQTVPAALRGRIRHVPGNHEVRWDPTAKGLYREQFGAVPYSFDAGGVHVTGFDPTQPLLEPGHCGAAALEWLDRDLAAAGGPTLLFQHFPVGGERDYIDDQAALLALLARHDVRVLVAGHVHRETVTKLDGPVQVTLQAVLKEPVFYWAELGDGPALTVSHVTVAADGTQTGSPVAAVPLTGPLAGPLTRPMAGPRPRHRQARGATAAGLPRPQWRRRLPGSVQAGIAVAGGG